MSSIEHHVSAGAWGNLETLNREEKEYAELFTPAQREALPKVNPLDPRGRIWMGSYPGGFTEVEALQKLDVLINEIGIKTILCLQEENELRELKPYRPLVERVAKEGGKKVPEYIDFPIRDVDVARDEDLLSFLKERLIPRIKSGDILPLYIHCKGGNGRTGTIAALLLSHLYGLDGETALKKVKAYHATRITPVFTAPETFEQRDQVMRLWSKLNEGSPSDQDVDRSEKID